MFFFFSFYFRDVPRLPCLNNTTKVCDVAMRAIEKQSLRNHLHVKKKWKKGGKGERIGQRKRKKEMREVVIISRNQCR